MCYNVKQLFEPPKRKKLVSKLPVKVILSRVHVSSGFVANLEGPYDVVAPVSLYPVTMEEAADILQAALSINDYWVEVDNGGAEAFSVCGLRLLGAFSGLYAARYSVSVGTKRINKLALDIFVPVMDVENRDHVEMFRKLCTTMQQHNLTVLTMLAKINNAPTDVFSLHRCEVSVPDDLKVELKDVILGVKHDSKVYVSVTPRLKFNPVVITGSGLTNF